MIRLLFLFFIIALGAGVGVHWLSKNSGDLTFIIMDYKIETSVTIFVVGLVSFLVALQVILIVLNKIINLPLSIRRVMKEKNLTETLSHLADFIKYFAIDEVSDARNHLRRVDKNLVKESTINICEMLIDRKSSDTKAFKNRLLTLTKNKDTSLVAHSELLKISVDEEDWIHCITYANEIWKEEKNSIIAKTFFRAMVKLERWEELLGLVDKSRLVTMFSKDYAAYLSSAEHKNLLMFVKYKLAEKSVHENDKAKALILLDKVMNASPKFSPAFELAAQILYSEMKYDQALKLVKKAWKTCPTSKLTSIALESVKMIYTGHVEKIYSALKSIASINPKHYESNVLLSLAALESERYDIASTHISEILGGSKKQRACILMAEYCERTHGSKTESIRWLRDAVNSDSDLTSKEFYWDEESFEITTFICEKVNKL